MLVQEPLGKGIYMSPVKIGNFHMRGQNIYLGELTVNVINWGNPFVRSQTLFNIREYTQEENLVNVTEIRKSCRSHPPSK